jgi:hypothetical protein
MRVYNCVGRLCLKGFEGETLMIFTNNRQSELANNSKAPLTGFQEGPLLHSGPLVLLCGGPPLSYALEGEIFHIKMT